MSRSAFLQVDRAPAQEAKLAHGTGLRVSQPGDMHEHEADKIADTVVRGGSVPRWSFSPVQEAAVQRDPTTAPPAPMSTGDMVGKVADAVMATEAGKKAIKVVKGDPVVKAVKDFATTPAGIVIAGVSAIGIVSTLAATKTALPFQIPKIPLDVIHPGLAVKIDYNGPVNHPTSAMLTLSYTPGSSSKKKKQGDSGRYGHEISELKAEQDQMRAMMAPQEVAAPAPGGPLAPRLAAPADVPAAAPDDKKKEEAPVQRKSNSAAPVQASAKDVSAVTQSGGRPLDQQTRGYMERRIGFDFSKVRVHDDATAAHSALGLQAKAYTTGPNIVFGSGQYSPASTEGRRLLAHELTHVVQQQGLGGGMVQRQPIPVQGSPVPLAGPYSGYQPFGQAAPPSAGMVLIQDLHDLIAHGTWPEIRMQVYPKESAAGIQRARDRKKGGAGAPADLTGEGSIPSLEKIASSVHDIKNKWATDPATTADDRVQWLGKTADDALIAAQVPKLKHAEKDSKLTARGGFNYPNWIFKVNEGMVNQPALPDDAAVDLANVTAHETRHAEQHFVGARYEAGILNLNAKQIHAEQDIPEDIAAIAVTKKMSAGTGAAEKSMGATMAQSMGTDQKANQAISAGVDGDIAKLGPALQEAQTALTALEASDTPATETQATQKRDALRAAVAAVKKSYSGYRGIPHEADAHEVGDTAELAYKGWK
jgi:hypothetical protein